MVYQVLNYLWCHYSGWEHKRIIYLDTKMLSLLQWHTASYCTWTLLCRRLTHSLKLSGLFDHFFLGTCDIVFLLFFLFVFFFFLSFVQAKCLELLAVQLERWTRIMMRHLARFEFRKNKKKGKCLAEVCRCFVHVPQPITNVTLQLH